MVVSTCQLANGSSSSSSRAARGSSWLVTCAWVSSYAVDLEPPAGLEVDVPQLDAAPPRLRLAAAPAGGQGAHEVLVVEHGAADLGERLR